MSSEWFDTFYQLVLRGPHNIWAYNFLTEDLFIFPPSKSWDVLHYNLLVLTIMLAPYKNLKI